MPARRSVFLLEGVSDHQVLDHYKSICGDSYEDAKHTSGLNGQLLNARKSNVQSANVKSLGLLVGFTRSSIGIRASVRSFISEVAPGAKEL